MPAPTSAIAPISPSVIGSFSHSAPNRMANTGVKNTNTDSLVAGYRTSIHIQAR